MYKPNHNLVESTLKNNEMASEEQIDSILFKAENLERLNLDEVFTLLKTEGNEKLLTKIFSTAKKIRDNVIGKVVYLPVPLYVTSYCANDCAYCAFRRSNKTARKRLNKEEFVCEVQALVSDGFKVIELVFAEDPFFTTEKIVEYVKFAKKEIGERGEVILNIAPTDLQGFRTLKEGGVDRIVQWQETYNPERYTLVHPMGKKRDFMFRVQAYERALDAGIKNVALGILFGLADYKFDVLSLIMHANYLGDKYKISPIIGIPRLTPALGAPYSPGAFRVNDEQLKLAVAVYRLALPYSNVFISTREDLEMALDLLDCGGGALLATKCSVKVGYKLRNVNLEQFKVYSYNPAEINKILREKGFIPSFQKPPYNLI